MDAVFQYGNDRMQLQQAIDIASGRLKAVMGREALHRVQAAASAVADIVTAGRSVYGINTGFGALSNKRISEADTLTLQHKILQSHSVGVGALVSPQIARLMLITKIQALAQGYSGVRPETLERIQWHLDQDIIPAVPEQGSVGASGDLAPLAHLFLPLIGLGQLYYRGQLTDTAQVLQEEGRQPLQLGAKEGLALINGTQFMLAYAVQGLERLYNCLEVADIIGAMSLESLQGTRAPFDARLHALRPFAGNQLVAQRLRLLLDGSQIMQSHADCGRVQDPYSLRCMPQVHGATRSSWLHLKELTEIELNAVTDNPIIFDSRDTISGGNFHGQPLALPMDYCCFAAAELGNISDRRCYLLLEGKFGLPLLLMRDVGLNSGFMIPQYTTAALVTENKTLCFPASADSVPTSLGQEDHVSMGSISGRKLSRVLDNLEYILAIELMSACQAIEFRRPLKSSRLLEAAHHFVRRKISFADEDRVFAQDIQQIRDMIQDFSFTRFMRQLSQETGIDLNRGFPSLTLNI
ncbi:histidine ammonia-lyase [Niabella terrae]